jgi:NADH-quinone oxidoreductase subunit G
VLARDNAEVDDGWLCDKGRFGYQMFASPDRPLAPQIREGGALREASWAEAIERAANGLAAANGKVAAIVGGGASNEEGYLLQRMVRGPLASSDVTSTPRRALSTATRTRLNDPALAVATPEIDGAGAILVLGTDPMHEMPILELRIRKAVRRNGAQLLVATERPTALDGGAAIGSAGCLEAARVPPGGAAEFLRGLTAALRDESEDEGGFAAVLREAGSVVVAWGERIASGAGAEDAAAALLDLAAALDLAATDGSGLYEVPLSANGRGLRESGVDEGSGPGLRALSPGRDAAGIRDALEAGELDGVILWDVDPVRDFDDPEGWARAIGAADFTLSVSMFGTASAQNADVHFPAESHAEKEGTVTHPDGRLQRVRPSVPHPGRTRPLWQVLTDLSAALGDETGAATAGEVFDLLADESQLYRGITYDDIGGVGLRWHERLAAGPDPATASAPAGEGGADSEEAGGGGRRVSAEADPDRPSGSQPGSANRSGFENGELRLGTYPDLWADFVAERNDSLRFQSPTQTVEVSPATAEKLGIKAGQDVLVSAGERSVRGRVALRERVADGVAFLIEGTREEGANVLDGARIVTISEAPQEEEPEDLEVRRYGVGEREAVSW